MRGWERGEGGGERSGDFGVEGDVRLHPFARGVFLLLLLLFVLCPRLQQVFSGVRMMMVVRYR